MSTLERFQAYADAFEESYKDDDCRASPSTLQRTRSTRASPMQIPTTPLPPPGVARPC